MSLQSQLIQSIRPEASPAEVVILDAMLSGVGAQSLAPVLGLVHLGQPVPQERARGGKSGRHYTPKRSRDAQEALASEMLTLRACGPLQGNLAIACIFYRGDQRTADGDNLLKLVADAGTTAGLWRNDSQITGWACRVELDRENPRTVIALAPHVSTLRRDLVRVK